MDRLLGPQGIGQAGSDKVDTDEADEVIDAIAKTVAELTSQQDGLIRKRVIEHLMQQIMHHDAEFRREEMTSAVGLPRSTDGSPRRARVQCDPTPKLDRPGGVAQSIGQALGALLKSRRCRSVPTCSDLIV